MKASAPQFAPILIVALTAYATKVHDIPSGYTLGDRSESVVIGRLTVELAGPSGLKPIGFFKRLTHLHFTIENESTGES